MEERTYLDKAGVAELWKQIGFKIASDIRKSGSTEWVLRTEMSSLLQIRLDIYTNQVLNPAIEAALADCVTAEDLAEAIAQAGVGAGMRFEVVDTLPETGSAGVIYLVPNSGSGDNIKDEYMWINGGYERIGSTEVDLSQYVQKSELRPITEEELAEILV